LGPRLAGLPVESDLKGHRDGTHRVVAPERTLERILPLMPRAGITRLVDLTGLDRLDIPVFAATRPNSRSLAVFQGKGVTPAAAKVSALMEAIETYCAETATPPLRLASLREIARVGDVADVAALPRSSARSLDPDEAILWTAATDVATGAHAFVPFEMAHANYALSDAAGQGPFAANTNGLASGNTFAEALAHALYELIERDGVALWSLSDARARAAAALDLASVESAMARDLLARFDEAGIDVGLWDASSDIGLPVFQCLVADREETGIDPEIGSGCHPSREVALVRALTEAAQSRATWISGARDDFEPDDYRAAARARRRATSRAWLEAKGRVRYADMPDIEQDGVADDLAQTLLRLARVGAPRVLALDLTRADLGVPVVRAIVPGLEGLYQLDGHVPGARGRRRASQ